MRLTETKVVGKQMNKKVNLCTMYAQSQLDREHEQLHLVFLICCLNKVAKEFHLPVNETFSGSAQCSLYYKRLNNTT